MQDLSMRQRQLICLPFAILGAFLGYVLIAAGTVPIDGVMLVKDVQSANGKIVELSPYFSTAASKNPNREVRRSDPHKTEGVDVCIEYRSPNGQARLYETWDLPTVDYFKVGDDIRLVSYNRGRMILGIESTWPQTQSIIHAENDLRRFLQSDSDDNDVVATVTADLRSLDHIFQKLHTYTRVLFHEQNAEYQSTEVSYRGSIDDWGEYEEDSNRRLELVRSLLGSN